MFFLCADYDTITEEFYKNIDRKTAEQLLNNRQNGTFIIRPSTTSDTIGTLSLVQDGRFWHLNVRKRKLDGMIALGVEKENEKCFRDVDAMINYYVSNYLVLYGGGRKSMALLLPYREQIVQCES